MKIYERIVMDWDGNVLEDTSFDYQGDVALCGGGGGKKPKVQAAPPAPEPVKEPVKDSAGGTVAGTTDARRRAQMAAGLSGTNVTGGSLAAGAGASTQKKNLMGQ